MTQSLSRMRVTYLAACLLDSVLQYVCPVQTVLYANCGQMWTRLTGTRVEMRAAANSASSTPSPVFLGTSRCGNHAAVKVDSGAPHSPLIRWMDAMRAHISSFKLIFTALSNLIRVFTHFVCGGAIFLPAMPDSRTSSVSSSSSLRAFLLVRYLDS